MIQMLCKASTYKSLTDFDKIYPQSFSINLSYRLLVRCLTTVNRVVNLKNANYSGLACF